MKSEFTKFRFQSNLTHTIINVHIDYHSKLKINNTYIYCLDSSIQMFHSTFDVFDHLNKKKLSSAHTKWSIPLSVGVFLCQEIETKYLKKSVFMIIFIFFSCLNYNKKWRLISWPVHAKLRLLQDTYWDHWIKIMS